MSSVNKIIFKIVALVLLSAFITVLFVSMALARRDQVIYPSNVSIGGISIANLNYQEALARLQAGMKNKWPNAVQLKINETNVIYSIPLAELRISYNLDSSLKKTDQILNKPSQPGSLLKHAIMRGESMNIAPVLDIPDRSLIYDKLAGIKRNLDKPASNARISFNKGYLEYVAHKNGFAVDLDASFKLIENELKKGSLGPITLITKELYPKVKIEDIKTITDLIGVSVISLESGSGDKEALAQIITKLNGIIVMPGDQFSWQTAVDTGASKSQPNDQQILVKLNEAIFSACEMAHLNIINTDPGKLVFSNNLGKPLMLSLAVEGNEAAVKIFGCQTVAGKEILLIKEQTSISPEVEVQVDNKLKPGARNVIEGQEGKMVRTYRLVKINGKKTEKKLLSEEVFPPRNTIMKVAPDAVIK